MKHKISIIITTHNRVKMLRNLLSNLKKQTYKNFSVVIIDDASKDTTKYITKKNFKAFFACTIFHSEENLKMVKARNKGLSMADKTADYIFVLDDDNRVDKDFLEK